MKLRKLCDEVMKVKKSHDATLTRRSYDKVTEMRGKLAEMWSEYDDPEEVEENLREQVEAMLDMKIDSEFQEDLMSHASDTSTYTDSEECEVNMLLEDLRGLLKTFMKMKNERAYNKFIQAADDTEKLIKSNRGISKFKAQFQEMRKLENAVAESWEEARASRSVSDSTVAAQSGPMVTIQPMAVNVNNEPAPKFDGEAKKFPKFLIQFNNYCKNRNYKDSVQKQESLLLCMQDMKAA